MSDEMQELERLADTARDVVLQGGVVVVNAQIIGTLKVPGGGLAPGSTRALIAYNVIEEHPAEAGVRALEKRLRLLRWAFVGCLVVGVVWRLVETVLAGWGR